MNNFLEHTSVAGLLTILVLLGCSVYVAALSRDLRQRWLACRLEGDWLLAQVRYLLYSKKQSTDRVQNYLGQLHRPVASILKELLFLQPVDLERGDYLLASLVDRERAKLESGLAGLGTVAVIAPFVGLFGTVIGITKTFADVAKMGKAGIEVVSAGVSEALVATAIGLLVAIVSVVLFNFFKSRFESEVANWDTTARSFLSLLTDPNPADSRLLVESLSDHSTRSADDFLNSQS